MSAVVNLEGIKLPRVYQHILFWLMASVIITAMYAVQSNYSLSLRNNILYMPVQIGYYYLIAYWLIPKYLFVGRYTAFVLLFLPLLFVSTVISRIIGVLHVSPYMIQHGYIKDADYIRDTHRPFLTQVFDIQNLVNALKGTNFIIGFVLAIKLFKMWYERKQAALQAELNGLKAQVHPHFLFNTLNNLYALSLNQSPKSPQVILGLSDILRYMLYECNADEVLLEKEVFMMQQYVKLEKLRYEDRIDISFNISGNFKDKLIAPLLIIPFIENAFKHGASETVGQVWINIDISVRDNHFKLKVANNNPGKPEVDNEERDHIGLKNVAKRLVLLYPGASHLKIMDEEDTFLIVLSLELNLITQPVKQVQKKQPQPVKQLAAI